MLVKSYHEKKKKCPNNLIYITTKIFGWIQVATDSGNID